MLCFLPMHCLLLYPYYENSPSTHDLTDNHNVVARMASTTQSHLNNMLHNVVDHGGEGIILQKSSSRYEHGRSTSLLKVKVSLCLYFTPIYLI
jgi:ATP-dependent DNA ligase